MERDDYCKTKTGSNQNLFAWVSFIAKFLTCGENAAKSEIVKTLTSRISMRTSIGDSRRNAENANRITSVRLYRTRDKKIMWII